MIDENRYKTNYFAGATRQYDNAGARSSIAKHFRQRSFLFKTTTNKQSTTITNFSIIGFF
jgi:hypothetical protein